MGTREHIAQGLAEALHHTPYDKMTVTEICRYAHISRKTFYDQFENKDDVLEWIFFEKMVRPIVDLNNILHSDDLARMELMLNEQLYRTVLADRDFWYAIVYPMKGRDGTFLKIATNAIYRLNSGILDRQAPNMPAWKHDYVAYFFASSQAMLLQKWISDGMEVSTHDLAEMYNEITAGFWPNLTASGGRKR